jgi:hypothetical protein
VTVSTGGAKFDPPPPPAGNIVGFYGCRRVVRVEWVGTGRPTRSRINLDPCPVCDRAHDAAIGWRKPTEFDDGLVPDLLVEDGGSVREPSP